MAQQPAVRVRFKCGHVRFYADHDIIRTSPGPIMSQSRKWHAISAGDLGWVSPQLCTTCIRNQPYVQPKDSGMADSAEPTGTESPKLSVALAAMVVGAAFRGR